MTQEDIERAARLSRADLYATERLGLKMHPKQCAVLRDVFSKRGSHVAARCANEIGKTTHIGAPAILHALEILDAQAISTAGVWMQVKDQLVPAIKRHSGKYPPNWEFLDTAIKINGEPRYVGFSTRDEGFAQGFHRQEGRPLLAIIDEAAAVEQATFNGVDERCNPDYLLVMGSPLDPSGPFYDIETKFAALYSHHHISQMDCLTKDGYWIDLATIERKILKWGEQNPLVQSNVFGEFPDIVEGALISLAEFDRCANNPPKYQASDRHLWMDFAAGRAKNVIAVRVGNRAWIEKKWTERNTMSAVGECAAVIRKLQESIGLQPDEIDGDADGLGLPMLQRLEEVLGFKLGHFHGNSEPRFVKEYANEISECWGEGTGKAKRLGLILPDDADFKAQTVSRKLKRNSSGKLQLESKEDMAARGLDSPDEADAIWGASMPAKVRSSRTVMGQNQPPNRMDKGNLWGEPQDEQPAGLPGAYFG